LEVPLDSNNQNDINSYVHASVLELKENKFPNEVRKEIQDALIEGSNGMFLRVYLILYDLKTSPRASLRVIRQKLKTLPKSLPDLYRKILVAVKPEDLETANNILRWVVWAEQPLTVQELTTAIAIQPEHRSMSDLSEIMQFYLEKFLRSVLGALITVQNNTVHLVHQSTKEYLKAINSNTSERFSLQSKESNLYITISCLTYISFSEFETELYFEQDLFYKYSSSHWLRHMSQLDAELQRAPPLKVAFLHHTKSKKAMVLAWFNSKRPIYSSGTGPTPLVIASLYGLQSLVEFVLDDGVDIDGLSPHYGTALQAAAGTHDEVIVHYLVERGANINAQGGYFDNALQAAAYGGKADTVRYLVERGANINAQGGLYGNALQAAAYQNKVDIVRYLVDQGANINAQGGHFDNAFQAAAYGGKADTVRYLVERGADINARGGSYGNALQAAVSGGKADTVHYLVETGADVNALQAAAYHSNLNLVRYLVERGANVNAQGGLFDNALQAASYRGKADIVRYLVERGADINAQGGLYGNSLQTAAYQGYDDIVHYLVERGANVNAQGGYFDNALQAAVHNGKEKIVHYLVEHRANVNAQGAYHGNALQAARELRRSNIADYLVANGVDLSL
jgi:ankyrin repeat protein